METELTWTLVLFGVGFFILIQGANVLVRGASSVARLLGMSNWLIGIAVVGIGTSVPELSINLAAAFSGTAVGLEAIIGSNTFNILLIIGMLAIVAPLTMRHEWVHRDFMLNIGAVGLAAVAVLLPVLGDSVFEGVTRLEGAALLFVFLLWLVFVFRGRREPDGDDADQAVFSVTVSFFMITAGIIGVFLGGQWVVDGAETIAIAAGISPALVALTVVAAGTSLPELTVSMVALRRGRANIAVGNIIGSNIFDFLGIVGITALVHPISVRETLQFDIFAALGAAVLLLAVVHVGQRHVLTRQKGILLLGAYLFYIVLIVFRG